MTAAPSPTGGDETEALDTFVDSLRGFDEAYSTRFFREVSDEDGDWLDRERPNLQAQISASMGRHLATFLVQAADTIDALRAKVERLGVSLDYADGVADLAIKHRDAAESLAAERAAEVGRLTSQDPSDAMVKAGVAFALGGTIGGDHRWPDYIRDLYQVMRGAASGGGDDA